MSRYLEGRPINRSNFRGEERHRCPSWGGTNYSNYQHTLSFAGMGGYTEDALKATRAFFNPDTGLLNKPTISTAVAEKLEETSFITPKKGWVLLEVIEFPQQTKESSPEEKKLVVA